MTFLSLEALTWAFAYWVFVRLGTWIPLIIPSVVQLPIAYLLILGRRTRFRRTGSSGVERGSSTAA